MLKDFCEAFWAEFKASFWESYSKQYEESCDKCFTFGRRNSVSARAVAAPAIFGLAVVCRTFPGAAKLLEKFAAGSKAQRAFTKEMVRVIADRSVPPWRVSEEMGLSWPLKQRVILYAKKTGRRA